MSSIPGNDFNGWRETLSKLSSFAIHKVVKGISEGEVTIRRQVNGDIYLTDNLLKYVFFGDVAPVTMTAHKSLNSSNGVVRN